MNILNAGCGFNRIVFLSVFAFLGTAVLAGLGIAQSQSNALTARKAKKQDVDRKKLRPLSGVINASSIRATPLETGVHAGPGRGSFNGRAAKSASNSSASFIGAGDGVSLGGAGVSIGAKDKTPSASSRGVLSGSGSGGAAGGMSASVDSSDSESSGPIGDSWDGGAFSLAAKAECSSSEESVTGYGILDTKTSDQYAKYFTRVIYKVGGKVICDSKWGPRHISTCFPSESGGFVGPFGGNGNFVVAQVWDADWAVIYGKDAIPYDKLDVGIKTPATTDNAFTGGTLCDKTNVALKPGGLHSFDSELGPFPDYKSFATFMTIPAVSNPQNPGAIQYQFWKYTAKSELLCTAPDRSRSYARAAEIEPGKFVLEVYYASMTDFTKRCYKDFAAGTEASCFVSGGGTVARIDESARTLVVESRVGAGSAPYCTASGKLDPAPDSRKAMAASAAQGQGPTPP